jgi:hypothetical protein
MTSASERTSIVPTRSRGLTANEKRLHMNRTSALALLEQHPAAGAAQMRIRPLGGNMTGPRPRDKSRWCVPTCRFNVVGFELPHSRIRLNFG